MTIKTGDLVMVVKPLPCCGYSDSIGKVFLAGRTERAKIRCLFCQALSAVATAVEKAGSDVYADASRLKKIDPPADGDSLPTRADIEVPA